ncbi:MAG: alpha/beta fold hydrolase, partial [Prochlorothrix sp.]
NQGNPNSSHPRQRDLNSSYPPLVFCHGLGVGSSAFEWSKIYPDWGDRHRLIVPEFVGWGRSDKPDRRYQIQDYLDQLEQILTEIARSPAWVIAASLTGGLALRLATQKPHLFQGLALVSPSGYGDFGQTYRNPVLDLLAQWEDCWGDLWGDLWGDYRDDRSGNYGGDRGRNRGGTLALSRSLYQGLTQPWAIAGAIDRFLLAPNSPLSRPDRQQLHHAYTTAAQQPRAHFTALATLRGSLCFDLAPLIPHLQTPTHLLWGTQAQASPLSTGHRLQQLNPHWIQSLTPLPNSGMVPHLEQPDSVQTWLHRLLFPPRQ